MSFYRHVGGKCIKHRFVEFVDLVLGKRWRQCKDCGVKP